MIRNLRNIAPTSWGKAREWKDLGNLALAELICTPERTREITEKLYPEHEMRGRPLILYAGSPGETLAKRIPKRDAEDEPVEVAVGEEWGTGNEFPGSEEELVEEMAVAA